MRFIYWETEKEHFDNAETLEDFIERQGWSVLEKVSGTGLLVDHSGNQYEVTVYGDGDSFNHVAELRIAMPEYVNTKKEIQKRELSIKIIEGIQYFQRLINSKKQSISGFAGTFPELKRKMEREMETYYMCINRLKQRLQKNEVREF